MTLAEFKTIFWWEWTHRLLGRLIGAAFLLPFVWFLWRGWIEPALRRRLWGIFALGAVQGAVGWWMVASGLIDRVNVSQYRLAFHLTLAALIYAALIWTADRLAPRPAAAIVAGRARPGAMAVLVLVLVQIYLGALVAGLRAGLVHDTWPLIDGALVPDAARLWFETPWWRNLFDNTLTVQFDHRMVAYALVVATALHAADLWWRAPASRPAGRALAIALAMLVQAALGILTLLHHVPILLALAHQAMAMIVLALATLHVARLPVAAPGRAAVLAASRR